MPRKTKTPAPGSEQGAPTETIEAPKRVDFTIQPISETITIPIKQIITDAGTQARAHVDQSVVDSYAEKIKESKKNLENNPLPAIDVFRTPEGQLYLGDGFQRILAHKAAHEKEIVANIREGTLENAIVFSLQANHGHGLPRTTKDLQRALKRFFEITPDDQVKEMSNVEIAKVLKCSEGFVRNHRDVSRSSSTRTVTVKGKKRKVDVSRIGKKGGPKAAKASKKSKSGGTGAGDSSEAEKESKRQGAADDRTSILVGRIANAIGGREGEKVAEAILSGAISVTPKDLKEWSGLSPKMAKAITPLVATKGFKPWKAYEFLKEDPSERIVEELHNRAIAAEGGIYEFKTDGVKITVEHLGKKS